MSEYLKMAARRLPAWVVEEVKAAYDAGLRDGAERERAAAADLCDLRAGYRGDTLATLIRARACPEFARVGGQHTPLLSDCDACAAAIRARAKAGA